MKRLLLIVLLAFAAVPAVAAPMESPCTQSGPGSSRCDPVNASNPLPITGSSNVPTYSASASFVGPVSATDIFCVYGSSTKTIKIKGVRITGVNSTASTTALVQLIRRSTLFSGGTSSSVTPGSSDPLNSSPTATATTFTAAPTPGTSQGVVRVRYITIGAASTTGSEGLFQFTPYYDQPQVLRGSSNGLCVNAPTPANSTWAIDMEWSEE